MLWLLSILVHSFMIRNLRYFAIRALCLKIGEILKDFAIQFLMISNNILKLTICVSYHLQMSFSKNNKILKINTAFLGNYVVDFFTFEYILDLNSFMTVTPGHFYWKEYVDILIVYDFLVNIYEKSNTHVSMKNDRVGLAQSVACPPLAW